MPPTPAADTPARWSWQGALRALPPSELAAATAHLLLSLPVGIASFTPTLVLGVLAVSLLIVYPLALPVLVLWIVANRSLAAFERWRIGALLGAAVPASGPLSQEGSWHRRLWRGVLHPDTWRAAAYHLLRLPVGILSFTLVVTVFALPLGLLVLPLNLITSGAVFTTQGALAATIAAPVVGVLLLPIIPTAVAALRDFDVALATALLGPSDRERLGQRVEQLSTTRSEMVDIAEAERRRIERDLHDGAGQQLVSLAMTLGMAREKMATDPDNARVPRTGSGRAPAARRRREGSPAPR